MAKKNLISTVPEEPAKNSIQKFIDTSYEKQIKSGDKIDPEILKKSAAEEFTTFQNIEKHYPSLPGDYYDKYEDYINPHTLKGRQHSIAELNQMRFENQSLGQEIGHGLGRIATNIVPSIIGGFASMLDIPGYFSAEEAANNSIVNWAESWKQDTNEELFPIYTDPKGDTMDLTSSAWWASRGSGLVESILSFVAQGAGVGKGVSLLGKGLGSAMRGEKLFNALSKVPGVTNGAQAFAGISKAGQTLTTATMLNQSEAVIEASQVYKDTYDKALNANLTIEEAQQKAGNAAATTMALNRINILLNLSSASAFLTPFKTTRNIIKSQGLPQTISQIAKEGGQEAMEELVNHLASKAGMAKGEGKEYGLKEAKKDALTGEAVEAMFLGALGGIGQTAGTKIATIKQRKEERENYQKQQAIIDEMKEAGVKTSDVLMNLAEQQVYQTKITKAYAEGNEAEVERLRSQQFENSAIKAFESGTTQVLESMYKAEASRPVEEVGQEYIDNANKAVKRLQELEAIYNNFEEYENVNEIFKNRVVNQRNQEALTAIKQELRKNELNVREEVNNIAEKYKYKLENDVLIKKDGEEKTETISRDSPLTYSFADIENNTQETDHNKEVYNKFLSEVQKLESFDAHKKYQKDLEDTSNTLNTINKEFEELKKPEAQEKALKEKTKAEKKKTAIQGLSKNDSISDIENLKKELEDDEFNALADARITKIKEAKDLSDNNKKRAKIKEDFVNKIDKAVTEEELLKVYDQIETLELPDNDKEDLRKSYERKVARLNGEEVEDKENPLSGFDTSSPEELEFNRQQEEVKNEEIDPRDPKQDKKDVEQEMSEIGENILKDTSTVVGEDSQGGLIYNYVRSKIGAVRAAFLSRNYNQKTIMNEVTREEVTNEVQDLHLLNPDTLKEGTKISLEVKTDYSGEKYAEEGTIEWLDRLQQIKDSHGENYRQSPEYISEVPIIATDEKGQELFYIHDMRWINEENLDLTEEELKAERARLFAIRKHIITSGKTSSTITFKGAGHLMINKDGDISLEEAMPDAGLPLAVAHDELQGNKSFRGLKNVKQDKIQKGRLYAVIPVGDNHVPIPLNRKEIDQRTIDSIMSVVKAWITQDTDNPIVQEISNKMGIDITTTTGLEKYINHFIYLTKTQGNAGLSPFLTALPEEGSKLKSTNKLIGVTGNSLQFGHPGKNLQVGDTKKYERVIEISPNFKENINQLMTLESFLKGILSNASSDGVYFDKDVVLFDSEGTPFTQSYNSFLKETHETNVLGINIGAEDSPKYVYTIQPTILIDDSFIGVPVEVKKEPVTVEGEVAQEITEEKISGVTVAIHTEDVVEETTEELNDDIFKIEEGEEGFTDEDTDDLPVPMEPSAVEKVKEEIGEMLIKHISASTQESLISYLASRITLASIDAEKVNKKKSSVNIPEVLEVEKDRLKEIRNREHKNGNLQNAKRIHSVMEQWDKVTTLTKQHLALYTSGSVYGDIDEDSNDGGQEKTFSDDWSFTVSSKSTASADLKKFFAYIPAVDENGNQSYNILGLPNIVPFDNVYDTVHRILANKVANYSTMVEHLKVYKEVFPWLETVIENLENSSVKIKNEFVSDMTKHYVDMKFVMWSKDYNGNYMIQLWDSDNSSKQKMLLESWNFNLKGSTQPTALLTLDENNDYVFNKETITKLNNQAREWSKNPPSKDKEGFTQFADWLNHFGIILTDKTYEDLSKGRLKNKKLLSWQQLFTNEDGIILPLIKQLNAQKESKLGDTNLLSDTIIKRLAELDAKNASSMFSNSYRSGVKTIYSYSNNKYITNRVRDLAETDSEGNIVNRQLLDDLLSISFTKNSLWLNALNDEGKEGQLMKDNFAMYYTSLEALKKQNSASKDNRKLNNMSDTEHEVIKMGMYFNTSTNKIEGENRRIVTFFGPTNSDKSTMPLFRALNQEFKWEKGTKDISEKNVKLLYKAIVEPEMLRMTTPGGKNVKGYEPSYFYFLPNLNTKEVTIGDNTKTIRDWVIDNRGFDQEVQDAITEEIKEVFNKIVDKKLEIWEQAGIGKIEKGTIALIDKSYLTKTAEGVGKEKVRFAAMDFSFNYLIANAEMIKIGPGDPAQYFKKSSKEGATIIDHLEETFINLGKRLAGEIAPGVELADSQTNKFVQVFLADQEIDSQNVTNKERKAYFKKIIKNFDDKKAYSNIEGSDAQEYTTWKEHLYVMLHMGKLTEEQHKDITSKLNQGKELSYDDLGLVLQPMKPVYNGNIADVANNIDRKIYIKSSSFPLLPQLTVGMQLDKVRKVLEDFENSSDNNGKTVRASFGTANKVGAVKAIEIFNKNGTVKDDLSISKDNILVLERKNFRIQQEVPYKREKDEVNIGTQERKLLFVNMLDVEIEKGVTGKDLQEIYDNAYSNLFQYKYKTLMDKLGLVDTIALDNLETLYEVSEEKSIFDSIEEHNKQLEELEEEAKTAIQEEFEKTQDSFQLKRANYINENFDEIVKSFAQAKVNIFFEENKPGFDKNCK